MDLFQISETILLLDKWKFNPVVHSKAQEKHPISHGCAPQSPVFPMLMGQITYSCLMRQCLLRLSQNKKGHFRELDFSFTPICAMHEIPWMARDRSENCW